MNKEILKKLQETELKLLDKFVSICDKYNLEYYLAGGTLLGAVRHEGFIPWDDDIDVGMPRKDFNKFIEICMKELDKEYFLDCYKTNKYCYNTFIKLKLNNTIFLEESIENLNINHGIWIDIFPYDDVTKNLGKIEKIKKKLVTYSHTICRIKNKNYLGELSKSKYLTIKFISFFFSNRFINSMLHKILQFNLNKNNKYICSYGSVYDLDKEVLEKSDFFPIIELPFAGKKYKCPKNYDKILKKLYGDYMKLPPKKDQRTHNPKMIKFEDGEVHQWVSAKKKQEQKM